MLPLLALAPLFKPVFFGPCQIASEALKGERVYLSHQPRSSLMETDAQMIGTWFDGTNTRPTEDAIWLSPSLISRWLGYLRIEERWPGGEIERRWETLRGCLDCRLSFVVRLTTMPKQDPFELGFEGDSHPEDINDVRFEVSYTDPKVHMGEQDSALKAEIRLPNQAVRIAELESRNWREVVDAPWYRYLPCATPLLGERELARPDSMLPLGDNYASIYLIEVPLTKPLRPVTIDLRIFSPHKQRVAHFNLGPAPKVKSANDHRDL